jgi:Cu(I)/Ag(I) efflux system membrane protein CusA/SilA
MQRAVAEKVTLPPGYSIAWSGQFEYLERAEAKLRMVIPVTLVVIFVLLFLTFSSAADALLLMSTVPFALVGGFWLIWILGHAVSVATSVGFIALAGVAAEFGVVMLLYLKGALNRRLELGEPLTEAVLIEAIREGAVLRVRPKAMTVAVVLAVSSPSWSVTAPVRKSCSASPRRWWAAWSPHQFFRCSLSPQPGSCFSAAARDMQAVCGHPMQYLPA